MAAHALLGPSGASRWLACPPSARAELSYENTENEAAAEGTLAHDISEVLIKERLGHITRQKAQHDFDALKTRPWVNPSTKEVKYFYNAEMLEYCKGYMNFVLEVWSKALAYDPKAVIIIEARFELDRWIPESFGRTDVTIIAGNTLYVIDFKYGKGVRVEALGNKQTRLYALGGVNKFAGQYPLQNVEMYIYQPRLQNFGSDTISTYDLWMWAEGYVKPRAQKAFVGLGDYEAGDHCTFCRAKPRCRTASEYARTPAGSTKFADPNILTDEEIVEIAKANKLLMSYSKDVVEYMLKRALGGKEWPGFKIVEGRSVRQILDEQKAIIALIQAGYKEVYDIKIKTLGSLEALVGASHLTEILGPLLSKPSGKPTLVSESDSRGSYQTAASEFKVIK